MITPGLIERLRQVLRIEVKPKRTAVDASIEAMQRVMFPPITIEQHLAAMELARQDTEDLEASRKWQEANPPLPGNIYISWNMRPQTYNEVRHRLGYATTIKIGDRAWDKWGWPVGDPLSPARLYD